jgi:hypothetical protein
MTKEELADFDTKLVIDVFVDAKKEAEYYHSIHGIVNSDLFVRINGAIKYLWERDEDKKRVDKELTAIRENAEIKMYGVTLKEVQHLCNIMQAFPSSSNEWKEADKALSESETHRKVFIATTPNEELMKIQKQLRNEI